MSENKDLIQRLAAAEAEVAAVRAELAKAKGPEPWKRWEPAPGEDFWHVYGNGEAAPSTMWPGPCCVRDGLIAHGNVHPTREAAERHAKRLRSMVPTCPVPKVGQKVWSPVVDDLRFVVGYSREWKGDAADRLFYNRGQVFDSPESCAEWIAEFADAWTTLEDAS